MTDNLEALIARVDERTANIIENQKDFKTWLEHQDERICVLEKQSNRWYGRETGIAVVGSVVLSLTSVWVALHTIFGSG